MVHARLYSGGRFLMECRGPSRVVKEGAYFAVRAQPEGAMPDRPGSDADCEPSKDGFAWHSDYILCGMRFPFRSVPREAHEEMETKEKQYQVMLDYRAQYGAESLGLMTSQSWIDDPKRLGFMLARYKFVAKMFEGFGDVLEVGCGDGFGSRIVAQAVKHLTASDFDPVFVEDVRSRMHSRWQFDCQVHDMMAGPFPEARFDGIYALDVLEHVDPADEGGFLRNLTDSLVPSGTVILGMPSLESQDYASPISKEGHVNCKSSPDFKQLMQKYFQYVFMFSMNDEVVHTGYHKMAHYLFALCCSPLEASCADAGKRHA